MPPATTDGAAASDSDGRPAGPERPSAFATLIRRRRQTLGIDQADLAARMNVSQQTISRWESAENVPVTKYLRGLADALQLSESEVLITAGVAEAGSGDVHVHLAYVLRHVSELESGELLALLDTAWTEYRNRVGTPSPERP